MFELKGPLKSIHQFIEMAAEEVEYNVPGTGEVIKAKGCKPAMGHTFSSGTIDGPGLFSFDTGSTSSTNPLWNLVKNVIPDPSVIQVGCHAEKSILISTGEVRNECGGSGDFFLSQTLNATQIPVPISWKKNRRNEKL